MKGSGGEVQGANNGWGFGGLFGYTKVVRLPGSILLSIGRNTSLLRFRRVQSLLFVFCTLVRQERARLVLEGRPTSLAASLSSSTAILICVWDTPIRVLYERQRSVRNWAAVQGSDCPSRATGRKAVSLVSSHSHIKSFYEGGSMDAAICTQPQLLFLEALIVQADLRNILS